MKKTILCLMMAVVMVAGLAACGGTTSTAPAASSAPAASTGAAQTTAPAATSAAAEPVSGEKYAFSLYGNIVAEMKNGDKVFFDALMEQTNTQIEVILPPSSNYDESLTIMMASGDYPNLVLFPDHNKPVYMDGVRNGVVLPVNEYLDNAPNLMQYSYEVSFKTLRVLGDDNIYGIPRTSIARADGYMIRQDWLDALGIPFEEGKPLTRDQFTEILKAFTENDPDGNGVNDTYGLGQSTGDGNLGVPTPIGWGFGLSGWQKHDGEDFEYIDPKYSKKNDAYKRALEYTNMLWNNKYIDPDWPTLNTDAQNQRFEQGITGIVPEFAGWMGDKQTKLQSANPDGKLSYIVGIVEKEGDKVYGGAFSTGFWGLWAVMSSTDEPQKVVNVLDYMLSDDFWDTTMNGVEGVAWNYDNAGNKVAIPDHGFAGGRAILRRNNAPGFFVGPDTPVDIRSRLESLIGICIGQAVFSKDEGFRPAIMDDPAFIDAEKEYKTAVSKIIVGDLPVSEYDAVLDKWYQAGGQTYIEQMNAGIAANQ